MLKSVIAFMFLILLTSTSWAEPGLYELLGVPPEATKAEIKSAWKKLVLQYHPDKFINDPVAAKAANEKLAVINAAETVIGNETLRAYYDFLSYKGKNHQRWASVPENQNATTLEKRFGSVEYVRIKYQEPPQFGQRPQSRPQSARPQPARPQPPPQQQQQPKPEPKPEPSATPKPTPPPEDTNKPPTKEAILLLFKKDVFTHPQWGSVAHRYLSENPIETSSSVQARLLEILTMPLADTNLERIAFIVAKTFVISDISIFNQIEALLVSRNPSFKKIGVALVQYAISEGRTQDILRRTREAAEGLIVERLNDSEKVVVERSKYAVQRLNISVQNNYDALEVIAKLSDSRAAVRNAAFVEILKYQDFNGAELKALNQQLLAKKTEFEKTSEPHLLQEMTAIIEIFEKSPDLTVIAKEFKTYRSNILGADLVLRSYALEKRMDAQVLRAPMCRNVFN